MKQRTTIYDIAMHLGITPSTVSRALHNHTYISLQTRKKVQQAAKKLNYKPNATASNLRTGGSKTIGVIVPQVTINFFANAIAGIEKVASSNGYNIIICQSDDNYEKEKQSVETLIRHNVACIMLSLAGGTKNTDHLQDAIRNNVPVVQFDRTDEKLDTDRVINDMDEIIYQLVKHLYDQGYKKIAYLGGPDNITIFRRRKIVFRKSLKKIGIPIIKEYFKKYNLTTASAKEAASHLFTLKSKPDAVFTVSDFGAMGVWQVAKEKGIAIPHKLGICGFSNEPYTAFVTPSITTVNQFSREMGMRACELFLESVAQPKRKPRTIIIKPELLIRESTERRKKKS